MLDRCSSSAASSRSARSATIAPRRRRRHRHAGPPEGPLDDRKILLDQTPLAGARRGRPHARHGLHPRRCGRSPRRSARAGRRRCSPPPCRTEIAELAKGFLNDPVRVEVAPPAPPSTASSSASILRRPSRSARCSTSCSPTTTLKRVIVFARTKHGADRVAKNLAIDGIARRRRSTATRPERPPGGAQGLPRRPCPHPRRHRHRRARHRRARHHPRHQLRPARRAGELRPPHRPHRRNGADGIAITLCARTRSRSSAPSRR